jgi:hypothetical protein
MRRRQAPGRPGGAAGGLAAGLSSVVGRGREEGAMGTEPEDEGRTTGQEAPATTGEQPEATGGRADATGAPPAAGADRPVELIDMIWPETGLQTTTRVPRRPRDRLSEDDAIELQIDFVTLSLTPLEFIQLAAVLRMSIDGLLELHPGLQRAVVGAFDIRD